MDPKSPEYIGHRPGGHGGGRLGCVDDLPHRLADLLRTCDDLVLALLFGSRAHGRSRPDSDIDVAVLGAAPLGVESKIELMGRIGAEFGLPVDLVDLHGTPEPVTGEALRGVRLVGSDAAFAELVIRHLDNVEDFLPLQRRLLDERRALWLR